MSESSSPPRCPIWASDTARLAATVDLPTPPLPLATATTCRTSGMRLESWAIAFWAASSRAGGFTTFMLTWALATPGTARTVRSTSSRTFSPAAGLWVDIWRSTTTAPALALTWCTKPKETMSRLMPGNFPVFRASQTADSRSFAMLQSLPPLHLLRLPCPQPGGLRDAAPHLGRQLLLPPQPVGGGVVGRPVGDRDGARPDGEAPLPLDGARAADAHRHDGEPALQGEQEAAALEREEGVVQRPGPLGEEDERGLLAQPGGGRGEGLDGGAAVGAVDGDEPPRPQGPAEDGDLEQAALGHHADLPRGGRDQHREVEQALMVGQEDIALPRLQLRRIVHLDACQAGRQHGIRPDPHNGERPSPPRRDP